MPREYTVFRTEKNNGVFWVVMSNEKKRNSMGSEFWRELSDVFLEADGEDTQAVVLAADGKTFCAGIDLMGLSVEIPSLMSGEPGGRPKQEFFDVIQKFQAICSAPEICRKPVIAAIHGHCIGGGLDLAAACDIRLASKDAVFSLREAAVAMVADLGSLQRLPPIIGEGFTRELALSACDIDAERALSMHLVNAVYEDRESCWRAAQELGEKIGENSPLAVETTKDVLNRSRGRTVDEGLVYAALKQTHLVPNPDLYEAVGAFAEKRKPDYGKK